MSTYIGFGVAVMVIWMGVISHADNPLIYLDPHALILVVGGTIAAGLIAFPLQRFKNLGKFLLMAVFYPSKTVKLKVAEQVLRMAGVMQGLLAPEDLTKAHHPFLAEGYQLMRKSNLDTEDFKRVLLQRNQSVKELYTADAKMLNALAKFPPAFGLLGATTGMITMMSKLGSGGQSSIGPAMAIALVATFWGIAVANLILLPLADHANRLATDQGQARTMMLAGLVLVHEHASIDLIHAIMCRYLPLDQQNSHELNFIMKAMESSAMAPSKADTIVMKEYKNERVAK